MAKVTKKVGIIVAPNSILTTKSDAVDIRLLDANCRTYMDDDKAIFKARDTIASYAYKLKAAYEANKPIQGLSLPQLGYNKCGILVRIKGTPVVMFNPSIRFRLGIRNSNEGCESVQQRYIVKRHLLSFVTWFNEAGVKRSKWFAYKTLRIIEHEVDHLDGILISEKGKVASCSKKLS